MIPEYIHLIASILDHPSVYMGGPSRYNVKKAERIWEALEEEGYVKRQDAVEGSN